MPGNQFQDDKDLSLLGDICLCVNNRHSRHKKNIPCAHRSFSFINLFHSQQSSVRVWSQLVSDRVTPCGVLSQLMPGHQQVVKSKGTMCSCQQLAQSAQRYCGLSKCVKPHIYAANCIYILGIRYVIGCHLLQQSMVLLVQV